MNIPREIVIEHSTVQPPVTREELVEVERIIVNSLFSLWLQEKSLANSTSQFKYQEHNQQQGK